MPYKKNVAQIRSYVPLLEKKYGIKLAGWMLIYVSRDSSFKDYDVIAYEMSEKEKAKEWANIIRSDKHFGIVKQVVKTKNLKLAIPLVEEKPCKNYDQYKNIFLTEWDKKKCPLGDTKACFDKNELRAMVKEAMVDFKNGDIEFKEPLKKLTIIHPTLEAKRKRKERAERRRQKANGTSRSKTKKTAR